jgi:putative transposase
LNNLHANSCRLLNEFENDPGRTIWYQYWDYCIRNKPDFWRHFNYIVQNPLKHGLVSSFREVYNYKFSSNSIWKNRMGEEGLGECFARYPLIDWSPTFDD